MINHNNFPSRETVERLRRIYPQGCRVELIELDDPYVSIPHGEKGTVTGVDDIGTIFVQWDCGIRLGAAYGADRIRKL